MVAIRTFDIGDTMLKAGAIRKQRMESELMGKALETAESDYELQRAGAFNAFVTGALPKVQLGDYRDFYDHLKTMGNPEVLGIPTPDKAEKMTPAAWSEYKYGKIKKDEKELSFKEKNYEEWKQANPDGTRMAFEKESRPEKEETGKLTTNEVTKRIDGVSAYADDPDATKALMTNDYLKYIKKPYNMSKEDAYARVLTERSIPPEGVTEAQIEETLVNHPEISGRSELIRILHKLAEKK